MWVVSVQRRSIVTLCLFAAAGCKGDKAPETTPETPAAPVAPAEPSARTEGDVYRNFLDEVGRAEVRAAGLIINMGTADQHKYTRGGWGTGWSVSKRKTPSAATTSWARATLDVLLDRRPAELVVRARAIGGGHSIVPYIGDAALGKATLGSEFKVVRFAVPAEIEPGIQTVSFRFSRSGSPHTEIDWIYLAQEAGAEPGPIEPVALPVSIDDLPKRALVAPGRRSYSFYVQPVEGERLVTDVGSEVGATFEIRAHIDGVAEPKVLWSKKDVDEWTEVEVDLGALAGKAVRIELAVTGKEGVSGWGEPVLMRPERADTGRDLGAPAKNLVYILIDTARADAFAPGDVIKTPAYDELASHSARFTNAYNNENWTKPSVATTLSGVYPSTHHTKRDDSAVPEDLELISQRLKRDGFATAGFVANGYVSKKFGFEKGWDHFTNYIRESRSSEAEKVYAEALAWLEKQREAAPGKRYFLYIQTIDPHVNYAVDEKYWAPYLPGGKQSSLGSISAADQNALSDKKGNVAAGDLAWLKALYSGEITYHDEHMGKFLDAARAQGLLDNTAIIVSNDHGEELGERDRFGHGHSLYEEIIRSPLLVHFPPLLPDGTVIDDIVEQVDMVPTMLDLLGLEPSPQAEGQSLLPLITGEPVSRPTYAITEFLDGRRSVRVGHYKLMRSNGTMVRVFDLEADPGEQKNLSASAPIARRLCETYLGEGLAVPTKARRQQDLVARQRFEAGKADISDSLRRKFEALGYFGARPEPVED